MRLGQSLKGRLGRNVAGAVALLVGVGVLPGRLAAPAWAGDADSASLDRPRLVVLISIDQFRADYLTRWADFFLPPADESGKHVGGFRFLMERGAWYSDAHHDHYPLFTGPGHCVLATGAHPGTSGIVGNEWGKRTTGERVYCVRDDDSAIVGGTGPGVSPKNELVTTIGDELKIAAGRHPTRKSKVWGLAMKDRASVLMAGHLADGALWFDDTTGKWISSRWYCKDAGLPAWVVDWNDKPDGGRATLVDAKFGATWAWPLAPDDEKRVWLPDDAFAVDPFHIGKTFASDKKIDGGEAKPGKAFYKAFGMTPLANAYVLATAKRLIDAEGLGSGDGAPDLLAINLSSNDYLGHAFGPDSPEVLAMTVETDRLLADFMDGVVAKVPGGLGAVTFVLTADHGVAPIPGAMSADGIAAGLFEEAAVRADILSGLRSRGALDATKTPDWLCAIYEANVYINPAALSSSEDDAAEIAAEVLRKTPGIASAYTRSDILHGRLPPTDAAARVARGFHDKVSGNVVFVVEPNWLSKSPVATSHGTPYAYDTSVPILFAGHGVRDPGRYRGRVSTPDIAATLADELGVLQPSGCVGRVLPHRRLAPERESGGAVTPVNHR